jgi:cell division protein FtsQ
VVRLRTDGGADAVAGLGGHGSKKAWMESVLAARLRRPRGSLLGELDLHGSLRLRTLAIAAIAALALAGGFMLFRSSPLVAVQQVRIMGVAGARSAAVSRALEIAAKRMSTLDYSVGELEAAVAPYRVVRAIRVSTSFPHRMTIEAIEQPPVAQLSAGGMRSAVAADGVVLGPALASSALPVVPASVIPAAGRRVSAWRLRGYLAVLGAAPAPLLPLIARVFTGGQGLTVKMANGLLVYFGDDSRPHAKWDALVSVLVAQGSAGASYVDVREPERAAAGVPSGGVGSGESGQVSASDPTSAALAASLARAVNGEPSTSSAVTSAPGASSASGAVTASGVSGGEEASPSSSSSVGTTSSSQALEGSETAPAGG